MVISSLIISFFALLIYFNNKNLVVTNHVKIALLDSGLSKKNYIVTKKINKVTYKLAIYVDKKGKLTVSSFYPKS